MNRFQLWYAFLATCGLIFFLLEQVHTPGTFLAMIIGSVLWNVLLGSIGLHLPKADWGMAALIAATPFIAAIIWYSLSCYILQPCTALLSEQMHRSHRQRAI